VPQQLDEHVDAGNTIHQWTIQEYEQHERGTLWYVSMVLGGLGLIIFGLVTGNFLFSLIIILFSIILYLQSHQQAPQLLFSMTDLGIVIGSRFYTYKELDGFYIVYDPPRVKTLFFETTSPFRPLLRIPLLDANPLDVRGTLLNYLEEDVEKEEEPLSDQFGRNWKLH